MLPNKEFFRTYAKERNIPWQDRNILLEYLQTQILKALSLSDYNDRLSFFGGPVFVSRTVSTGFRKIWISIS